jgi:hypothetical protein
LYQPLTTNVIRAVGWEVGAYSTYLCCTVYHCPSGIRLRFLYDFIHFFSYMI